MWKENYSNKNKMVQTKVLGMQKKLGARNAVGCIILSENWLVLDEASHRESEGSTDS
jgi:hypothetical protein